MEPSGFYASILVPNQVLLDGDEAVVGSIRRQLVRMLSEYIATSKLLDGTDNSGFKMEPSDTHNAMRVMVAGHFLTPKELETLLCRAYQAGKAAAASQKIVSITQSDSGYR